MTNILILTSHPLSSREEAVLESCLGQAGLRRKDVTLENVAGGRGIGEALVQRVKPNVVLCLGDEAAQSVVPEWPDRSMQERRGYFWDGVRGSKVIGTFEPGQILKGGEGAGGAITKMLFIYDIQRAREESSFPTLRRPERVVEVVDTKEKARNAKKSFIRSGYTSCDIEIWDTQRLQCIGFAASSGHAFVFTECVFDAAFDILRNPNVSKVFHNGTFDTYFLRTRYGVNVQGYVDDTIIGFHCCWPELAGQGEAKSKRTQKSLRFLASLYTKDVWWKDYDTDEAGMYYLNGLDCMITWDVSVQIKQMMKELDISPEIYVHEMSLIKPVNLILERGIRVDEERLEESVKLLSERQTEIQSILLQLARPILEQSRDKITKPHLFWKKVTCKGCRNGRIKRQTCEVCNGVGQWEEFEFNPNSNDQKVDLLYYVLGCDKRYEKGKLTCLEDKLKDILGGL